MRKDAKSLPSPKQIAEKVKKPKKRDLVAFRLEGEYIAKLEKLAQMHEIGPSTLIAQLVREYLDLYS